ncbi:hypothetical protein WIW50_08090 [Flavobacteriaceae bacterium 3-367]|uniref:hypothetical protein n=1 Tax=Eudoraea algarum TaxID=3417568 RepID=UPI00327C463D
MKKAIIVYISLALATVMSCKEQKKEAVQPTQMQHVMAIHDEVMPKMGALGKLVAQLKSKIDTTASGRAHQQAMEDLQQANTSMMDWMVGFGNRFDSDEIMNGKALSDEKQKWLDEEETKIKEVRDQINNSIKNAEALLQSEE